MSSSNAVRWAVGNLGRLVKSQTARMKPYIEKGQPLTPQEQVERYLAGAETWRLETGQVTPEEWERYENAMQNLINQQQGG